MVSCPGCAALEQRVLDIEARLAGLNPLERALTAEPTVAAIVLDAAMILGHLTCDIVGRGQTAEYGDARRAIVWAARHSTSYTLSRIGRAFGGRDHTTVRNLLARADARRREDTTFRLLSDILLNKARDRRAVAAMGRSR
jgi:chromosomal replication initiator protein